MINRTPHLLGLRCGVRGALLLARASGAEPLEVTAGKNVAGCLTLGVCEAEAIDALVPVSGEPIALSKLSLLVPDHVHEHLERRGMSLRSHFAARADKFCCSRDANNVVVVRRTRRGGAALSLAGGAVCVPPPPPKPSKCGANDAVPLSVSTTADSSTRAARKGPTKVSFTDVWNAVDYAERCLVEEWAEMDNNSSNCSTSSNNGDASDIAPVALSAPTVMSQHCYWEPYFAASSITGAAVSLATTPPRLIAVAALLESAVCGTSGVEDTTQAKLKDGEERAFLSALAAQPNVRRHLFVKSICRDSLAAVERRDVMPDDAGVVVYDDPLAAGSPVLVSPERFLTLVSLSAAAQLSTPRQAKVADAALRPSPCSLRHTLHFESTNVGQYAAQRRHYPQDHDAFRLARTLAVETATPWRVVASRATGMLRSDDVAAVVEVALAFPELFDCCDGSGTSVREARGAQGVSCRTIHGLRYRVHPRFLPAQLAVQDWLDERQAKNNSELHQMDNKRRVAYLEEMRFRSRLRAMKEFLVPECDPDVLAYALYDALEPHEQWPPETGVAPRLLSAVVQERTNGRSKRFLARYPHLFRTERLAMRYYLCRSEWATLQTAPQPWEDLSRPT